MHQNLVELCESSCRKYPGRALFGTKRGSEWTWLTYGEFKAQVDALRGGLAGLGIGPGDRVAIVADNCVEWATAAYATYGLSAVFVPMYTAQKPDEWQFILGDCAAKVVFAATEKIYEQLKTVQDNLPGLLHVIGLALPESEEDSYKALLSAGRKNPVPTTNPEATSVAGFVYTSGTTGQPKGVVLSHKNICSNVEASEKVFTLNAERSLAFLPWAHSFGQTAELHFFVSGGHAIAINDDVGALVNNLPVVRPSILLAVPRIFNRIYDGVHRQMASKPAPIQALFRKGLKLSATKRAGKPLGFTDQCLLAAAEKLIFSKVRAKFGGRLKLVISGSAALNKDVAEFIDALGIMVYEGYGLTETSPVASTNYPGNRKIGTVGKAIPGCRIELDFSKSDNEGEGEIIIFGPNVMQGYHNQPEETAKVLRSDGGFRSGDLGRLDEDGYLTITGRIKEQYKLENGKYISPAVLEEKLKLSPYIANIMLFGANKPYNVALVVPDVEGVKHWAKSEHKCEMSLDDERVKKLLSAELERIGADFKTYERARKFAIISEDFTTQNGLLTPSMKIKRSHVTEKYQAELDALY